MPADPHSRLTAKNKATTIRPADSTAYRTLIGRLLYVACMTRPDIAFAVTAVSRYSNAPGKAHWTAAKRILAYLAGTMHYGICYAHPDTGLADQLKCFSDSDYAGCLDTRWFTSDLLSLLNGGPVAWKSHLQKPVAQSTAEVEYYAAGHESRDITQSVPTPLFCDNNSAILLVHNTVFHDRTKHIEVKFHLIRDYVRAGHIKMLPVAREDQLADIFTKPLSAPAFETNRTGIGIIQVPSDHN